jgi:hypothetical protein
LPSTAAQRPGPETDRRNLHISVPKLSRLHLSVPYSFLTVTSLLHFNTRMPIVQRYILVSQQR